MKPLRAPHLNSYFVSHRGELKSLAFIIIADINRPNPIVIGTGADVLKSSTRFKLHNESIKITTGK